MVIVEREPEYTEDEVDVADGVIESLSMEILEEVLEEVESDLMLLADGDADDMVEKEKIELEMIRMYKQDINILDSMFDPIVETEEVQEEEEEEPVIDADEGEGENEGNEGNEDDEEIVEAVEETVEPPHRKALTPPPEEPDEAAERERLRLERERNNALLRKRLKIFSEKMEICDLHNMNHPRRTDSTSTKFFVPQLFRY